jgi:hypothetical protein
MPNHSDTVDIGRTIAAAFVRLVVDELITAEQAATMIRDVGYGGTLGDAELEVTVAEAAEQLVRKERLLGSIEALWLYCEPFELERVPGYQLGELADEMAGIAEEGYEFSVARLARPAQGVVAA